MRLARRAADFENVSVPRVGRRRRVYARRAVGTVSTRTPGGIVVRAVLITGGAVAGACAEDGARTRADGGTAVSDAGDAAGGSAGAPIDGAAGTGGLGGTPGVPDAMPDAGFEPLLLSETGLYADVAGGRLAPDVREFSPEFELWSDGAEKRRFLFLPAGSVIDTTDPDSWVFPVGTKAWKEFTRAGVRVETRLLWKRAEGKAGWLHVAYVWNPAQSDAVAAPAGVVDAAGTGHDVPSASDCSRCHAHGDQLLGVSALQLDHASAGVELRGLVAEGRLSVPPALPIDVPGSPNGRAALGYLHANCGNCHNPRSSVFATVSMQLWLGVGSLGTVAETTTYRTTVGVMLDTSLPLTPFPSARISPGDPEDSALWRVMGERGNEAQMPPLGTELVDPAGRAGVEAWITGL